jgi:hypothetical protein
MIEVVIEQSLFIPDPVPSNARLRRRDQKLLIL